MYYIYNLCVSLTIKPVPKIIPAMIYQDLCNISPTPKMSLADEANQKEDR